MNSIQYYHIGGVITIDELLKTAYFSDITITKNVLLEFSVNDITNHRRLYDNLTNEERISANNYLGLSDYDASANYPATTGVTLYIPINNVEIESKYQSNLTIVHTKDSEYFPPILKALTNDPGYISAELDRGNNAQQIFPKYTVWLWSRSKYLENTGDKGFVNITDDVLSLNIETSLAFGAVFNISLQPLQCKWGYNTSTDKDGWQPMREDNKTTQSSLNRHFTDRDSQGYTSESLRNLFYYEMIIGDNDLIFISFEKLKIDGQPSIEDVHDKWYDMIGLVDNTVKSISTGNLVDVSINVRGRDLSKALFDDNSYFSLFSRGNEGSLYGGDIGINDRFFNGNVGVISAYINKTIQQAIEFVIARLTSIEYVPDEIMSQFTSLSQIVRSDDKKRTVKGIWQLIKVFIDPTIEGLRTVDDNVSAPDGSIYDLFNKIAQMPFIEFFCDTYGDKYYLIFRQPPFTQKALRDIFTGYSDKDINPDFAEYKVLSGQSSGGATKDQVNKYKQIQIDFLKQTKSDIDSRNKVSIQILPSGIPETTVSFNNPINFNRVINIHDKDVISDNLQFCTDSYAWYKITDRGNYAGTSVSLGNFPALYFDTYAKVFGNRRLEVVCNYSDYRFFDDKNKDTNNNAYAEQASQHLAFLVETNAYLPFTRLGSITINGDRRIKKGNWIYYRPTREVFYVVGVSNSVSVNGLDRTTTVNVERGMVIDYIKNKDENVIDSSGQYKTVKMSYFNIVDIDKLQKDTYDVVNGDTTNGDKFNYKKNMIINEDVFNFFLQKKQFKATE